MTIKSVCTRGRRLKARDQMASRRAVCPRGVPPFGLPSRTPTHAGTTAPPLSPPERLRLARQRTPLASPITTPPPASQPTRPPRPPDSRPVHLLSPPPERRPNLTRRYPEKHRPQCPLYPLP